MQVHVPAYSALEILDVYVAIARAYPDLLKFRILIETEIPQAKYDQSFSIESIDDALSYNDLRDLYERLPKLNSNNASLEISTSTQSNMTTAYSYSLDNNMHGTISLPGNNNQINKLTQYETLNQIVDFNNRPSPSSPTHRNEFDKQISDLRTAASIDLAEQIGRLGKTLSDSAAKN